MGSTQAPTCTACAPGFYGVGARGHLSALCCLACLGPSCPDCSSIRKAPFEPLAHLGSRIRTLHRPRPPHPATTTAPSSPWTRTAPSGILAVRTSTCLSPRRAQPPRICVPGAQRRPRCATPAPLPTTWCGLCRGGRAHKGLRQGDVVARGACLSAAGSPKHRPSQPPQTLPDCLTSLPSSRIHPMPVPLRPVYMQDADTCRLCVDALGGCETCQDSSMCTACKAGYYLDQVGPFFPFIRDAGAVLKGLRHMRG